MTTTSTDHEFLVPLLTWAPSLHLAVGRRRDEDIAGDHIEAVVLDSRVVRTGSYEVCPIRRSAEHF